ncbi:MAG: hypothetical protein ACOYBY_06925 [Dermatophilaceae bacterium]
MPTDPVPPTSVPPTSVPPTSVPPTSVPPTAVPPTAGRVRRQRVAADLAKGFGGVVHRADLRAAGIDRNAVRNEVTAGRWVAAGTHTVVIGGAVPHREGRLWQAVWESGSGAVLDGSAALVAAGLTGFEPEVIDVSVPAGTHIHRTVGVRVRRRRSMPPSIRAGLPRARPEWATIHAAQWARTDRTAALLVCLPVQQRLVPPRRLLEAWRTVRYSPRRLLLGQVLADVCDGAQSLGELDFARMCRARGLPEPTRQTVRRLPSGRVYLDVAWEDVGLVVEIDGGHHVQALNPVDDALRNNELTLGRDLVLRLPVLGLRLAPDAFVDQVVRAYWLAAGRAA